MSEKYATYKVWDGCEAPNNLQDGSRLVGQIVEGAPVDRDALISLASSLNAGFLLADSNIDAQQLLDGVNAELKRYARRIFDMCGVVVDGR